MPTPIPTAPHAVATQPGNENPKPFTWHKSADEILQRLAGYCAAINQK